MTAFPVTPQTGFGGVSVEFYRDDSSALMPDWTPQPVITQKPIPGGTKVYVQTAGWNADVFACIGEVADAYDAQRLRALQGTSSTLTLPAAVGSLMGTYRAIVGSGFRQFVNTVLTDVEPLGGRRNGRFRFRLTFEREHGT